MAIKVISKTDKNSSVVISLTFWWPIFLSFQSVYFGVRGRESDPRVANEIFLEDSIEYLTHWSPNRLTDLVTTLSVVFKKTFFDTFPPTLEWG